ncbi:MAG: sigma-70 family RNA polymerase sigma factor [Spirosomaceae bacterium]|jgi:RNA polymerase sigma-70 factor (ECF subfamily)|nr:sigma-70 family RNA polymerase sigma factor [Spirosomataceae bacterium]
MQNLEKEFISVIEANQGIIHKVCGMYCHSTDDKKDLFQEIVIQLWRSYPKFRGDAKVSSWLYQIALNTAITQLRRLYRKPQHEGLSESIINITESSNDDEQEAKSTFLYHAISKLSEIEKAIIMLYLEEHSNDEIAQIMGITQNNVRVKLHRIQEKIRGLLNTNHHERA